MIENVDQRNDQISVRLASGGGPRIREFKIQDGMLFDAVHYGDHIEFTVQTIEGAKTIVSLRRE